MLEVKLFSLFSVSFKEIRLSRFTLFKEYYKNTSLDFLVMLVLDRVVRYYLYFTFSRNQFKSIRQNIWSYSFHS